MAKSGVDSGSPGGTIPAKNGNPDFGLGRSARRCIEAGEVTKRWANEARVDLVDPLRDVHGPRGSDQWRLLLAQPWASDQSALLGCDTG